MCSPLAFKIRLLVFSKCFSSVLKVLSSHTLTHRHIIIPIIHVERAARRGAARRGAEVRGAPATEHRRFEFEESPWKWSLKEVAHSRRAALTPNSQRPLPGGHPGVQELGHVLISRGPGRGAVCGRWPRPHIITPIDRARLRECPPTPVSADGAARRRCTEHGVTSIRCPTRRMYRRHIHVDPRPMEIRNRIRTRTGGPRCAHRFLVSSHTLTAPAPGRRGFTPTWVTRGSRASRDGSPHTSVPP